MNALHGVTGLVSRYTTKWLLIIVAVASVLLLSSGVLPFQIVGAVLGVIALIQSISLIAERNVVERLPSEGDAQTRASDPLGNAGAIGSTNTQTGMKFTH